MTPLEKEINESGFALWRVAAALQLRNSTFSSWLVDTTLPDEKVERVRRCIWLMKAAKQKNGGVNNE